MSRIEDKPAEAYPLAWPVGWPRARYTSRAAFADTWTLYVVREKLSHELRLLNATSVALVARRRAGQLGNDVDTGLWWKRDEADLIADTIAARRSR